MRYLNKIIFINSAGMVYADISIDGNVHFIGTQGVGKSTTLRAILFFYNADKLKLGIEKGKRSFDEYYFPHSNSYIIYEVARETGPFCVLAFRSQGRVAFRFIDGPYDKSKYVGSEGKALTWDQIREKLTGVHLYTRKVERYEEYRDILYGNNRGTGAEFRKYALIESRQYQNLPRTIQNVFLNSKLEAEFIKQTIIMSLNEEEVKIDLDQYSLHLKDFEVHLEDISKWNIKNRAGEIIVRLIADSIARSYADIIYLEKEKNALAKLLAQSHSYYEKALPVIQRQHESENEKLTLANRKISEADERFREKKEKIIKEITLLNGKLTDAKQKSEQYERINIGEIISRVSKRIESEKAKENLQKEKNLITALFQEITTKYQAMVLQNENRFVEFRNLKDKERNELRDSFYDTKENLITQYADIVEKINSENLSAVEIAREAISIKTSDIHSLKIKKREAELSRWFEYEIEELKTSISQANNVIHTTGIEVVSLKHNIESRQKQWDLDLAKFETDYNFMCQKHNSEITKFRELINQINTLLINHKHSFFQWLNDNKPGWEHTIGKVVRESILFDNSLFPQKLEKENGFYGVDVRLEDIATSVKSISDYEKEISGFEEQIKRSENTISSLTDNRVKEHDKLKKKYHPLIKTDKENIAFKEYESRQAADKLEKLTVTLENYLRKAKEEKDKAIAEIDIAIRNAVDEELLAKEELTDLTSRIKKQIDLKVKERDIKIAKASDALNIAIATISEEIKSEEGVTAKRIEDIRNQENASLGNEGADVARLKAIDLELNLAINELEFIENNRQKVYDYDKDKRELFDNVEKFKVEKKGFENQLSVETQRHQLNKGKLQEAADRLLVSISALVKSLKEIEEDFTAFERFKQTDIFLKLDNQLFTKLEQLKAARRLIDIINDINEKSYSLINRLDELRAAAQKFLGHFSTNNIFGFKTNLIDNADFMTFAENLKEFLDEDKISVYENRTNERFSNLISQIGKETTELVSKEATIEKVIKEINTDFEERIFTGVIKSISLRLTPSANKIVTLLGEIRKFNDEHALTLGKSNLFSGTDTERNNKKAIDYLKAFTVEISTSKLKEINLSDTFELQFKVIENENDSGWVEKLSNVGSEGTDILVKAMINIMLLNVFKESASKRFKEFRLHCMMDEIGKLHPNNVKGILKFANDRNILLINSSPTSYNALDYRHTYLLAKNANNITTVKKLITNN